jgi:hypothetical protein
MLIVMKAIALLLCAAGLAAGATLTDVRKVYLFPMGSGYDQILASRLAGQHLVQIVIDPKTADAFLTDRLGPVFEATFAKRVLEQKNVEESPRQSLGMRHGTLFLVSKSKELLWSTYNPPKDASAKELDKAARKTVEQFMKDLQPLASDLAK